MPGSMPPQQNSYGYAPNPSGGTPNMAAIMNGLNQRQPSFPQASNPNQAPHPAVGAPQDLASILAALQANPLQQQQANQAPLMGMAPNMGNVPFAPAPNHMLPMGQPQNPQILGGMMGQDQAGCGPPYENESRRRLRMQQGGDADNVNGYKPPNKSQGNKDSNGLPFRVKPCTYWLAGKCTKGDRCTFLHANPD